MDALTCRKCNKTFSVKQALLRHLKNRHGKQHKVKCPLCRNLYTRIEGLQIHFKAKHSMNLINGMDIEVYSTRAKEGELLYDYTKTYFAPNRKKQVPERSNNSGTPEKAPEYCTLQYVASNEAIPSIGEEDQEILLEQSLEILEGTHRDILPVLTTSGTPQ